MSDLSLHMRRASRAAENPEGLTRKPGGFWSAPAGGPTFGTTTVQALVTRGVAAYSEFADGRNGRFPIRIELIVGGVVPPLREQTAKPWTPADGYFAANPQEAAAA